MSVSTAPSTNAQRRGPWRWIVALLATALLVVSGSGLVVFAQSGAGESRSAEWVPEGTPILVVGRLDMPGGQQEALAQVLTAFPGFADAATFDMKLSQVLDDAFTEATEGAISYSGEIESFLGGEIGLAMPNVIEAAMSGGDPDVIVGIAITDPVAAESFLTLLTADEDDLSEEAYSDTTIISDGDMALSITDEWILFSQSDELIKASLDTLAGDAPSLADQESYATAAARVPDGHLALAYMDLTSFGDLIDLGLAAAGEAGSELVAQDLIDQLPRDLIAYVAAGPDTITVEAFITPGAESPVIATGESDLATQFPGSTQIYIETREFGSVVKTGLSQLLESIPAEDAQSLAPFEDMLGVDLASYLDFLGDTAVGASLDDSGLWLGIIGDVADESLATTRLDRILSLVRLFGVGADAGISIEEEEVAGTNVTTITLPTEGLTEGSGLPVPIGDTISIAVADGRFLLGTGDFVVNSLELEDVDSLALSPGYADALGDNTDNAGVLYANIGGLMSTIDPLLAFTVPDWAEVRPWVIGLDRFVAVGSADDEVISTRMTLFVETP